jgi:5-methylcytosine-specific restriction endonuclease McrA
VRITDASQGFSMLFHGRARALDAGYEPHDFAAWASRRPADGDEAIGTPRGAICIPRVLLLHDYNRVPRAPLRLSRRHVYMRDGYTCQYCGKKPGVKELNLDHVLPRSRGGRSSWENLVTSCRPCNLRKGWATPDEAGMLLSRLPVRPSWSMALSLAAQRRRFVEWEPFLASLVPVEAAE